MRTAWKAIPTLSRTCAHCYSGLSAARGSAYAAGIRQELDEWQSLTDAPARPPGSSRMARALNSGQRSSGNLALQVAHLVSEAALTRGARLAFFDRADHTRRPVTDHQQRVRQPTPAYVVEELPAARRGLLAAWRRCGAEYDAARRGTVDYGLWGRRGRPRRVNGGADCRLRSDHRFR